MGTVGPSPPTGAPGPEVRPPPRRAFSVRQFACSPVRQSEASMTQSSFPTPPPSFAEMYERLLVPALFRPFAEVLIDRAEVADGDHVLDVACGTGIVARLARERVGDSGRVVGVDLSPPMLAVARGVEPEVDWREGNATALPLGPGEVFD